MRRLVVISKLLFTTGGRGGPETVDNPNGISQKQPQAKVYPTRNLITRK
jgi:hypothetical protein